MKGDTLQGTYPPPPSRLAFHDADTRPFSLGPDSEGPRSAGKPGGGGEGGGWRWGCVWEWGWRARYKYVKRKVYYLEFFISAGSSSQICVHI
jgi:hypothetical protein